MKIFILILNFNGKDDTLKCLKSLQELNIHAEIVVIDNCSTDESVKEIKQQFSKIKIIKNKKNLGFAGGNNIGIRYALLNGADEIILLNNDTIVNSHTFLKLAENHSEITGGVLEFYRNGELIYDLGGHINWWIGRTVHDEVKSKSKIEAKRPDYVSGAVMCIRKEVFEQIGLLDERFFIYYEDADFCTRAKKAGFTIAVEPKTIVFHKLGAFKGRRSLFSLYHNLRSNLLFINKNLLWWRRPLARFYWLLLLIKVAINWFLPR